MIHRNEPQRIYKRALSSFKMVQDDRDFATVIRNKDAKIAIGHTRWKTMGANTDRNAHPFHARNILGAHNGMVNNHAELDAALEGYKPLQVDSEVIFRLLNEVQPKGSDIAKLLPMVEGSLALTWYDQRDKDSLYVFRHDNPLTMAIVESNKSVFWSSEYSHLYSVMHSVYGKNWENFTVKENVLHRFFYEGDVLMYEKWDVEMPKYKPGSKYYWEQYGYEYDEETKTVGTLKNKPSEDKKKIPLLTVVKPSEDTPKKNDWDASLEDCAVCHQSIEHDDEEAVWNNDGEGYMLCGKCDDWWESTGKTMFNSLVQALEIVDTRGDYANNALKGH